MSLIDQKIDNSKGLKGYVFKIQSHNMIYDNIIILFSGATVGLILFQTIVSTNIF